MKILDGLKKDYYDYLAGIYGIDNDIVYDRRDGFKFRKFEKLQEYFIKDVIVYDDREKEISTLYENINGKRTPIKKARGRILEFALEVGYKKFLFEVERYLENGEIKLKPNLIKELSSTNKLSDAPIAIIPCTIKYRRQYFVVDENDISYYKRNEVKNPILSSTFIPSFIEPNIIWNEVYNYLISIRDIPIVDTRNDVQKLESFGFDKKTSFRNPVYNANDKKNRRLK